VEVMSYGGRGNQVTGGSARQQVPSMQMSGMSYPQQSQQRGYSSMPSLYGVSAQQPVQAYPIYPDVKFKKLPFYEGLADLLKPSSLAPQGGGRYQEQAFQFSLTPAQANKIANSRDLRPGKQDYFVQVQMRFALLETSCEQEDNFPPNIAVKINDKMCPLPSPIPTNKPGVEPKRPPRPVNITPMCRISPTVTNRIIVSWASDYGRCWCVSISLVQKLCSDDLLQKLKSKGARIADFTSSLIKQKLSEDADCEIATTSLRCSLMCPLGKIRMGIPARATTCDHLQCFDASLYLQMNERKPTWTCPVCDKPAIYDNLHIDGYFQEVLRLNQTSNEVTLKKDGSWEPLLPKKDRPEPQQEKRKSVVPVETLSDSDDDVAAPAGSACKVIDDSVIEEVSASGPVSAAPEKTKSSKGPEIITLESSSDEDDDSSDDEEEEQPPAKRQRVDQPQTTAATAQDLSAPQDLSTTSAGSKNSEAAAGNTNPLNGQQQQLISHDGTSSGHLEEVSAVASPQDLSACSGGLPDPLQGLSSEAAVAAAAITAPGEEHLADRGDNSWSVGTVDPIRNKMVIRKSMP